MPSKTPMTTNSGSERRAQGIDALDDVHGAGQATVTAGCRDRCHEDLVRREPAALGAGDRDEPARGVAQAIVLRGRRETPGRADELAAGDRRGLLVGEHHDRERVEARVERLQVRSSPAGLSAAEVRRSSRATASSSRNGPDAVRVSAPR